MTGGPRRRADDHVHMDSWTREDQRHYEAGIRNDLRAIRAEIKTLSDRVLMLLGAIGLLAFLLPLVAPLIRSIFDIPTP